MTRVLFLVAALFSSHSWAQQDSAAADCEKFVSLGRGHTVFAGSLVWTYPDKKVLAKDVIADLRKLLETMLLEGKAPAAGSWAEAHRGVMGILNGSVEQGDAAMALQEEEEFLTFIAERTAADGTLDFSKVAEGRKGKSPLSADFQWDYVNGIRLKQNLLFDFNARGQLALVIRNGDYKSAWEEPARFQSLRDVLSFGRPYWSASSHYVLLHYSSEIQKTVDSLMSAYTGFMEKPLDEEESRRLLLALSYTINDKALAHLGSSLGMKYRMVTKMSGDFYDSIKDKKDPAEFRALNLAELREFISRYQSDFTDETWRTSVSKLEATIQTINDEGNTEKIRTKHSYNPFFSLPDRVVYGGKILQIFRAHIRPQFSYHQQGVPVGSLLMNDLTVTLHPEPRLMLESPALKESEMADRARRMLDGLGK
jgi:hypothetical protein